MILLASKCGLVCLLLRQFKPLYILANSAIFSVAVFTYMTNARGAEFEVTGKAYEFCAFLTIATSDAIPAQLRFDYPSTGTTSCASSPCTRVSSTQGKTFTHAPSQ
mmetsp:Transcript_104671/g.301854  ORF Transcript_104671/g.301854 Transcript_104671/m.301854 type:complete len:106 (-) Transcript_104671:811-1128(-)